MYWKIPDGGTGRDVCVSKMFKFYVKAFYVMGKGLSGELSFCGQVLFLFNFGLSDIYKVVVVDQNRKGSLQRRMERKRKTSWLQTKQAR